MERRLVIRYRDSHKVNGAMGELGLRLTVERFLDLESRSMLMRRIRSHVLESGLLDKSLLEGAVIDADEFCAEWKRLKEDDEPYGDLFDEEQLRASGIDLGDVIRYAVDGWNLGKTHGLEHWARVERNGLLLAESGDVNRSIVRLFAFLHNHRRCNDITDRGHGQRAAEALFDIRPTLLKGLSTEEFNLLLKACHVHTDVMRTGNPTIDACLDADRLDLPRVMVMPDPARMATELGAYYARRLSEDRKALDLLCPANDYYGIL